MFYLQPKEVKLLSLNESQIEDGLKGFITNKIEGDTTLLTALQEAYDDINTIRLDRESSFELLIRLEELKEKIQFTEENILNEGVFKGMWNSVKESFTKAIETIKSLGAFFTTTEGFVESRSKIKSKVKEATDEYLKLMEKNSQR